MAIDKSVSVEPLGRITCDVTREELLLLEKLLAGVPLKALPDEVGLSSAGLVNKRIRQLWERLGLQNRNQLMFAAGWHRLIDPGYPCLDEPCANVHVDTGRPHRASVIDILIPVDPN